MGLIVDDEVPGLPTPVPPAAALPIPAPNPIRVIAATNNVTRVIRLELRIMISSVCDESPDLCCRITNKTGTTDTLGDREASHP